MGNFMKRPEVLTFLIAAVMSALSGLAPNLSIPQDSVGKVVALFWTIFIGAVVEGKFKGADYSATFTSIFRSTKLRLGLISAASVVVNGLLQPLGMSLDETAVSDVLNMVFVAVGGLAGLDAYKTVTQAGSGPSVRMLKLE